MNVVLAPSASVLVIDMAAGVGWVAIKTVDETVPADVATVPQNYVHEKAS